MGGYPWKKENGPKPFLCSPSFLHPRHFDTLLLNLTTIGQSCMFSCRSHTRWLALECVGCIIENMSEWKGFTKG